MNKSNFLKLNFVVIALSALASLTTFAIKTISKPIFASTTSYTCKDIVFGEEVVGTGSTKDMVGSYYTITNWNNAKHTDEKATVIGTTTSGKYSGSFVINLDKVVCLKVIVYATGYEADALSNIYLAVNDKEEKVEGTKKDAEYVFKAYTFDGLNTSTLTFRNNNQDKKGRVCISKIVFRISA